MYNSFESNETSSDLLTTLTKSRKISTSDLKF